jgi:hypothetical protein
MGTLGVGNVMEGRKDRKDREVLETRTACGLRREPAPSTRFGVGGASEGKVRIR